MFSSEPTQFYVFRIKKIKTKPEPHMPLNLSFFFFKWKILKIKWQTINSNQGLNSKALGSNKVHPAIWSEHVLEHTIHTIIYIDQFQFN